MKIVKTIGALVLVALLVQAIAAQQKQPPSQPNGGGASSAAPLLSIETFTHDFGEVKAGTPLRFAFKIKNEGKADLLINSVNPG